MNDAVANLAADKYSFPSTDYSIIAGTGVNAAIPIFREAISKRYDAEWHADAINCSNSPGDEVFVNMELSMFGANAFKTTRWDCLLDAQQEKPGFQPLEQLCGGRYLGEILRLVLVDAMKKHIFTCSAPQDLSEPFRLDTRLMACFEADITPDLMNARKSFAAVFPDATGRLITAGDARKIVSIARLISDRAAAYLAASIVAMWLFRSKTQQHQAQTTSEQTLAIERVAFTGSVLEKYPSFRERCQHTISRLMCEMGGGAVDLKLEFSPESSLIGAAAIAIQ